MPGNEIPKDTKASLNKPDERLVYLALRGVFLGPDALLRNQRKVRDRIQKYKDNAEIKALLQQHSEDSICSIAKLLLERQVFESSLKAKLCFPEVFDVSPAQSAEREASIAEAAKSEADAIRNVAEGRPISTLPRSGHSRTKREIKVGVMTPGSWAFALGPSMIVLLIDGMI